MEYFASPCGSDNAPGTWESPFRTVTRGAVALSAGDILSLRHGIYVEPVVVKGKRGTSDNPVVIRSYPGERACIDGTLEEFRRPGDQDWIPALGTDPEAREDEFVSTGSYPGELINRGAFLDTEKYTRLITYGRLEDFRADNQTFERLTQKDRTRPGPAELDETTGEPTGYHFPWSYMGPGLWFDRATGRVHIRLTGTSNLVPGLADYAGAADPRTLALAISSEATTSLLIRGCEYLRLENLTVRFGGDQTVKVEGSRHLTLDYVRLMASTIGMRSGRSGQTTSADLTLRNCTFEGGIPQWYFRNDRKDDYFFATPPGTDGAPGTLVHNTRGKQTSEALIFGSRTDSRVEIANCEFVDGHDLYLTGQWINFHHNWIDNMQDEALALEQERAEVPDSTCAVHHNVITRSLSGLSFAGEHTANTWHIYRNLVDLRRPAAGYRPRRPGDVDVWRFGHAFKPGAPNGPAAIFQNTFLVRAQEGGASFLHYSNTTDVNPRASFNNIFVAVNPSPESDRAITFLPFPTFPGPTDGNCYHRVGWNGAAPFRYLGREDTAFPRNGSFPTLDDLRSSTYFSASQATYTPGFEAHGKVDDPSFRRIAADALPGDDDDLRLTDTSPMVSTGAELDVSLRELDPQGSSGPPAVGCYPRDGQALQVGVDGRRSFPRVRP